MDLLLHAWSLSRYLLGDTNRIYDVPTMAARAGFRGVEWLDRLLPSLDPGAMGRLAQAQERAGLTSAGLSLCLECNAPGRWVEAQVEQGLALLEAVRPLGVVAVRVAVGGGKALGIGRGLELLERLRGPAARRERPLGRLSRLAYRVMHALPEPRRQGLPPRARPTDLARAALALEPLARKAADLGMVMGLENHYGYTSHPGDHLALIEACGHGLGVCLDTGNLFAEQDPARVYAALAPRAVHCHFKVRTPDPEAAARRGEYDAAVAALRRVAYDGPMAVECEGPGDGLAGAIAGARALRELWTRIEV